MAAIEPQKLWEQNDLILQNSADDPKNVPVRVVHPVENEGLMYADHVNPNNVRAEENRQREREQIAAMDAAAVDPVVEMPTATPTGDAPPVGGPAIAPEGAATGNGSGVGAQNIWKANA